LLREHWFVRDDVRLNYAEGPSSGPPMVLLHGGASRGWQSFQSLVPGLFGRCHLYALDLRGHGKSGWTPGGYTLANFADDIIAFVEERVGKPAILFGHSLGGRIALLVAAARPDLVSAVVVADTPFSNDTLRARIVATREEAVPRNAIRAHPNDPDFHHALQDRFAETFRAWDSGALLPAIESPVLILQADPSCGGVLSIVKCVRRSRSWGMAPTISSRGKTMVSGLARPSPCLRL
jgi:pimeloyl-ACP methyl ester carboxylesterase